MRTCTIWLGTKIVLNRTILVWRLPVTAERRRFVQMLGKISRAMYEKCEIGAFCTILYKARVFVFLLQEIALCHIFVHNARSHRTGFST